MDYLDVLQKKNLVFLNYLLIVALVIFLFYPIKEETEVSGFSWARSIEIEELRTFSESDWSLPSGARLKYQREEVYDTETVIDHYDEVEEEKEEPMKITFSDKGYLYIVHSYGAQETSGYSIRVTEAYEAAEGIVFCTELIGPGKEEPVLQVETYPYIVVKLKDLGLDVLFQ